MAHPNKHAPISIPHQVFLHLLMISMLYASVISLITLLIQYIDLALPDQLLYYAGTYDSIRFGSSVLLVAFPVFLLSSWLINRSQKQTPEAKDLSIRKWLIYLTLFIAGITIIIDLINFVNRFYSGELTMAFFLKVLMVLLIAAWVFTYYLMDVLGKTYFRTRGKIIAIASSSILIIILAFGFVLAGSPAHQRQVRIDEQRVVDLQSIQSQIFAYWTSKEMLPENLSDLEQDVSYFVLPKDPETGENYVYQIIDQYNFQLCATFSTETVEQSLQYKDYYSPSESWVHPVGYTCFEREIDPDFLKATLNYR